MARPVVLGNCQMMVGLNEQGLVNDFYYPYVGLDNLTTSRSVHHKIGVWVDGQFSWIDDGTWQIDIDFETDALISSIKMANNELGITINAKDFVDADYNSFIRRLEISNNVDNNREIRFFMHQVFQISRSGRADTALYVPEPNYVLDYKGRCALLIYGQDDNGKTFDQYCVGNYGIEGKEGTFKDAEDGNLENNAVEHGGVDSVIRFSFELEANQSKGIDYWITATSSQYECETVLKSYLSQGIDKREQDTRNRWSSWLSQGDGALQKIDKQYLNQVKKSLMIIKAHADKRGGVLASGDSSIFNYGRDYYCYAWPRDGAYAMQPLIRMGYYDEPKRFFEFCRDTLHRDGYLMHKYQPDRAIGSTWHPLVHDNRAELAIQEDETAIVVYMLSEYLDHSNDSEFVLSLYSSLIQPAANFMSKFIDEATNLPHASYDLWEEKFLSSSYTAAITHKALLSAKKLAETFEYPDDAVKWQQAAAQIENGMQLLFDPEKSAYRKGLLLENNGSLSFDNTIDASSLYAAQHFMSKNLSGDRLAQTAAAVEKFLLNTGEFGGVIRYEGDWYMRGGEDVPPNPWFVCTLWLARYYIKNNQQSEASELINWSLNAALHSGVMSEQVNPSTGWPVSVAPLVWSHAELINTILDLKDIK